MSELSEIIAQNSDPLQVRAEIVALHERMSAVDQVEIRHKETLAYGLYTRTIFIPKGVLLLGKIHKKPCVNIVLSGDISIATETGEIRAKAGYMVTSPAGIQKVGFAHEDTVFINVFRTDVQNIEQVESDLIVENYEALNCAGESPCLG